MGLLCREENIGCFPYFLLKSQQLFFINHRSVTQSKKMIQQCIFFTDIYLLVICMFFFMCIAFLWRANRTQGRGVVSGVLHCVQKTKYYSTITLTYSLESNVETYGTVRCTVSGFTVTVRLILFTVYPLRRPQQTNCSWFKVATAWCI